MPDFAAQVDEWVKQSQARMIAVFRSALDDLVDDMNTVKPKGGNLPIDTGFLRDSLSAKIGDVMPTGPSINPAHSDKGDAHGTPENVHLVISDTQPGDTVSVGYTAEYAKYREPVDGFVEAAAVKWPQFVNRAVSEAKRRVR